jgi:hypothetical protein
MVGNRKLIAYIVANATLAMLAGIAAYKLTGDTLASTLTGLGASVTLGLLYYCGGNVGEHLAQRGKSGTPVIPPLDEKVDTPIEPDNEPAG